MDDELIVVKEVKTPVFHTQDERDAFIQEEAGACWWIAEYLDACIPHIEKSKF